MKLQRTVRVRLPYSSSHVVICIYVILLSLIVVFLYDRNGLTSTKIYEIYYHHHHVNHVLSNLGCRLLPSSFTPGYIVPDSHVVLPALRWFAALSESLLKHSPCSAPLIHSRNVPHPCPPFLRHDSDDIFDFGSISDPSVAFSVLQGNSEQHCFHAPLYMKCIKIAF